MSPTVLKLAVCLFPGVTSLDFQGPLELFGFLSSSLPLRAGLESTTHQFSIQYLAPTLEPITPDRGPKTLADATYEQAREQFDVILVPGGGLYNTDMGTVCRDGCRVRHPPRAHST